MQAIPSHAGISSIHPPKQKLQSECRRNVDEATNQAIDTKNCKMKKAGKQKTKQKQPKNWANAT